MISSREARPTYESPDQSQSIQICKVGFVDDSAGHVNDFTEEHTISPDALVEIMHSDAQLWSNLLHSDKWCLKNVQVLLPCYIPQFHRRWLALPLCGEAKLALPSSFATGIAESWKLSQHTQAIKVTRVWDVGKNQPETNKHNTSLSRPKGMTSPG
jgi:hypothetical protein